MILNQKGVVEKVNDISEYVDATVACFNGNCKVVVRGVLWYSVTAILESSSDAFELWVNLYSRQFDKVLILYM